MYELTPIHDGRKSFYGKAHVIPNATGSSLVSYSTTVASIENRRATVRGKYSATTLRHIKEYLRQNGFKADTWRQIESDYVN